MKKLQVAKPQFDYLRFAGGFNTETKPWNAKGGELRQTQNYEMAIDSQGYTDIQGYEIFDGNPAPSSATYHIIDIDNIGPSIVVGVEINQATTLATAQVLAILTDGAQDQLVITKIVGTFDDFSVINFMAQANGTAASLALPSAAATPKLNALYNSLAADEFRTDVAAVPGSGSVLGIQMLNDVWYAFRNNAGGTAADLYKSSASGWVKIELGYELSFTSGGTYEILEGDVIVGQSSTAEATVTRVMLESGSWLGGDAAGRLLYLTHTQPFQAELLDVGGNADVASATALAPLITLLPNGRFEMVRDAIGGGANTERIYGADTVNRGFEFDGTTLAPIVTGMTVDTPDHVIVHRNHLFFSFAGSAQHSGIGTPYIFNPIFGAAEIATGDTITGFMSEPGSNAGATLGIYNRNTTHMLYGSSVLDWNLVKFKDELGAFAHTLQQLGQTMFLDDRGITNFKTAQEHGNFLQSTESRHIQTFIKAKKSLAIASCIARDKNQYRIFFTDKSGLYITTQGKKVVGLMPIFYDHAVTCISSSENLAGDEVIMFGSTDGKIYNLDMGTSFDGGNIDAYMKTFFHFSKSIRHLKKYLGATLEAEGEGYAEFNFSTELGYNANDISQPTDQTQELDLGIALWDTFVWDTFTWDGHAIEPTNVKIEGSAENISLVIRKDSNYFSPVNITGAMIRYVYRRQLR